MQFFYHDNIDFITNLPHNALNSVITIGDNLRQSVQQGSKAITEKVSHDLNNISNFFKQILSFESENRQGHNNITSYEENILKSTATSELPSEVDSKKELKALINKFTGFICEQKGIEYDVFCKIYNNPKKNFFHFFENKLGSIAQRDSSSTMLKEPTETEVRLLMINILDNYFVDQARMLLYKVEEKTSPKREKVVREKVVRETVVIYGWNKEQILEKVKNTETANLDRLGANETHTSTSSGIRNGRAPRDSNGTHIGNVRRLRPRYAYN